MRKQDKNKEVKPCNTALVVAVFEKFRELSKCFYSSDIRRVSIRIANADAMEVTSDLSPGTRASLLRLRPGKPAFLKNKIFLFSKKNGYEGQVGVTLASQLKNIVWVKRDGTNVKYKVIFEESVRDAIRRFEIGDLHYIAGTIGSETDHLIIAMPPEGYTLQKWLDHEAEMAAALIPGMLPRGPHSGEEVSEDLDEA